MSLDPLFQRLYDTPVAAAIRESGTLFPWVESIHVLAITLVVGSIAVVDLRLLGIAWNSRSISRITREILPFTWTAFAVAAVTGGLLFSSNAVKYTHNVFFLAKMSLLLIAFINMMVFHFITGRNMHIWDEAGRTPVEAKFAGGVSLGVWVAIVVCARWIGFTIGAF